MTENGGAKERSFALDLLRIVSMLMIITLHIGIHGGLFDADAGLTVNRLWFWLLNALCSVSVNAYVLISGYFLVDQRFRLSRIARLAADVLFYSVLITAVFAAAGELELSVGLAVKAVLPVTYGSYWFATAYVGMALLSPLLNLFLRGLTKRQHLAAALLLALVLSVWAGIFPGTADSRLGVMAGYSTLWFTALYVIGAYIKKHGLFPRLKRPAAVYLGGAKARFAARAADVRGVSHPRRAPRAQVFVGKSFQNL